MDIAHAIKTLTGTVWNSILNMPIEEEEAADSPPERRTLSACVQITGAWKGAVALTCDTAMAQLSASIMFALAPSEVKTADMQDALGELANMIGGNVKGLLPETCQLSLPSVIEGDDYSVRIPGSRLVTRVPFRSGTHLVSVSLLEAEKLAA